MRKKLLHTILLFLVLSAPTFAQQAAGDEWINDQQNYYKVPITKTGFYELSTLQLVNAGIPVSAIPSKAFQIFTGGREIPIELSQNNDEPLSDNGYIRFQGKGNDGANDTSLYIPPALMPHSYYSLYSDTAFYYLTWKMNGTTGKRTKLAVSDSVSQKFKEILQLYNSHYLPGTFYPKGSGFETGSVLSGYDTGEGWTGPKLKEDEHFRVKIPTENADFDRPDSIAFEMLLAGWSAGTHLFKFWSKKGGSLSRKLADVQFEDYNTHLIRLTIGPADLDTAGMFHAALVPAGAGGHLSVSYFKLIYPQKPNWGDKIVYEQLTGLTQMHFHKMNAGKADYLIITHPSMRIPVQGEDPVAAYAKYRASPAGGNYKPLIIHTSEIFDRFNYGLPGPVGLKNLIAKLAPGLKFVLLIGRSVDPQKVRKIANAREVDMVPNAGWPGSDLLLAVGEQSPVPLVPVGRINASTSQQVWDYLQKVKAMEAEPAAASWRKKMLHLSGGRSRQELSVFKDYVKGFEQKILGSSLGAAVQTLSKETDDPVEKVPFHTKLNKGAALLTVFGHSGPDVTDIDIGFASDPAQQYHNKPFFPAIIVNGCASGSIFFSPKTLSSDWIFSPDNGAVLFLAHTFNGVSTALKRYTDLFYEVLADASFVSLPFGIIQQEAIRRNLASDANIYDTITTQQMNLHGDPAIRIFPAQLPDYSIDSTSLFISDGAGGDFNAESDSMFVQLAVQNNGRYRQERYSFSFRLLRDSAVLAEYKFEREAAPVSDTLQISVPNHLRLNDTDLLEFEVDEGRLLVEENEGNNRYAVRIVELKNSATQPDKSPPVLLVKLDGRFIENEDLISREAEIELSLTDLHAIAAREDTAGIVMWIKPLCDSCEEYRLYLNGATWRNADPAHFYLTTKLPANLAPGRYLLTVRARDLDGNFAPDYQIIFNISEKPAISRIELTPNPATKAFTFKVTISGPKAPDKAALMITDLSGRTISTMQLSPHIGRNEWFWEPKNLAAGVYIYIISFSERLPTFSPAAESKVSGRLLWFP
ncbi:putative type IX secretion system sortase PorU2 [Dyadobacter crusticola]|uniref:putative type IX secretion system sortase PorU2 n=1 Tax=Dyadobacter crusticola TaxID=292407 RepID=UPI0006920DC6|nr:C25 family cysteine peptidase [Dyadobacter crusticola]